MEKETKETTPPVGGWKADENKPRPDLLPWDVVKHLPGFLSGAPVEILGENIQSTVGGDIQTLVDWYQGRYAGGPDATRVLFTVLVRTLTFLGELVAAQKDLPDGEGGPDVTQYLTMGLVEVSKVLAFGANKYAPRNWEKGIKFTRVYAAALRHALAHRAGVEFDEETGLPHLAHFACCVLFLTTFMNRNMFQWDDRAEAQTL